MKLVSASIAAALLLISSPAALAGGEAAAPKKPFINPFRDHSKILDRVDDQKSVLAEISVPMIDALGPDKAISILRSIGDESLKREFLRKIPKSTWQAMSAHQLAQLFTAVKRNLGLLFRPKTKERLETTLLYMIPEETLAAIDLAGLEEIFRSLTPSYEAVYGHHCFTNWESGKPECEDLTTDVSARDWLVERLPAVAQNKLKANSELVQHLKNEFPSQDEALDRAVAGD